jgi:hypothetical protein
VVIFRDLPKISCRGGDEALEGPGPWEAAFSLRRGSGAALLARFTTPLSARVAGVAEDAPGLVVMLVAAGTAGAASMVSDWPAMLGGLVALGAGAAPSVGGASVDAWSPPSSSPAVRGGIIGMVVVAGSGPGVVWLIFIIFFFFFFIFFFFSSFFSSASLERNGGRDVRRKVSQE